MERNDIIFCQFRRDQKRDYDIQIIKRISKGIIVTNNGYKIDANTLIENNKDYGARSWQLLSSANKDDVKKIKEYLDAKKWLARISEFPELLISAYRTCSSEDSDMRKAFHELSSDDYKLLFAEKMGHILSSYRRPLWCGHPFALSGWFGCSKLLKGKKIDERTCQACSCFVNPRYGDFFKRLRLVAGVKPEAVGAVAKVKKYKELEDGQRRATAEEIEKLMSLFCLKDWYFVDILKMLYTPKEERDFELDSIYRTTIQNKIKQK